MLGRPPVYLTTSNEDTLNNDIIFVALYKGQNGIRIQAPLLKQCIPDAIQEVKHR